MKKIFVEVTLEEYQIIKDGVKKPIVCTACAPCKRRQELISEVNSLEARLWREQHLGDAHQVVISCVTEGDD